MARVLLNASRPRGDGGRFAPARNRSGRTFASIAWRSAIGGPHSSCDDRTVEDAVDRRGRLEPASVTREAVGRHLHLQVGGAAATPTNSTAAAT